MTLPVSCRSSTGWAVAQCSAKGIRGSMEDVTVAEENILAILDGHNGRECADFVAPKLAMLVEHCQADWHGRFAALDDEFRATGFPSGSTCVAVVLRGGRAEVANLGDSRALLLREGRVVEHTVDHKPSTPGERERIRCCGGVVKEGDGGPARVGGVAVSRAFGTYVSPMGGRLLKDSQVPHAERIISCLPDVSSWPVQQGDVLVLACDGLWDVLSMDDVATITGNVRQRARELVERSLKTSTDNVSCIVAEMGAPTPDPEPKELCRGDVPESRSGMPTFNTAARADQLAIGASVGFGETLIEIMQGLETNLIVPGLWLGTVRDACYEPFLSAAKVTSVVNCASEAERADIAGLNVFSLPWRDSEEQARAEQKRNFQRLQRATCFIEEQLAAEQVVLVHCVQGVSRSASVVVAFLMERRGMGIEEAVAHVKAQHPQALRPFRFQEMLRAFHYFLKSSVDG